MNPTTDHNSEPPPGQPSSQSSMEPSTTNDSATSPVNQLPSELRTLHTLQGLRTQKAQAELTEATLRVQLAKERVEEAKHAKLAAQMQNLPHRALPLKVYNDGLDWIAVYECPEGEPLVGRGECPHHALCDLDHHWLGLK